MAQEEIFWWQKSRKDWILHRDRNIIFFHQKTIARRRRNRIEAIKDSMGDQIYNEKDIRSHAVEYFSSLFKSEAHSYQTYFVPNFFPAVNVNYLDCVNDPVVEEEIKRAIFSMKPLKAPGIDGLQAIFYQSQWHTIGPSFCTFIIDIFNTGQIPQNVNKTLLVLIPKVDYPTVECQKMYIYKGENRHFTFQVLLTTLTFMYLTFL